MAEIATDSGHWYAKDGTPAYFKPNGTPNTLREARKLGLYPSVTTILKCADRPNLTKWLIEQAMDACLTLPRLPDEPEDAFKARALKDSQEQSKRARERGSEIHGNLEKALGGLPHGDPFLCNAVLMKCKEHLGTDWVDLSPERSFAHPSGYGGKVDLFGPRFVLDFKTKPKITDTLQAYDEQGMQLVAYRKGLDLPTARLLNVFIGVEDEQVLIVEWPQEETDRLWAMFYNLLCYWQASKKHKP